MSWKRDKIIPIYKNGHGIYELIAELQKGEKELKKQEEDIAKFQASTFEMKEELETKVKVKKQLKKKG